MKYGRYLQDNIYPEWRFYYIDYEGLKQRLKTRVEGESFVEEDEAAFVETLDKEMIKVFDFRDVKAGELTRHVQHCENVVDNIHRTNQNELSGIEDEIGRITNELSQLATFSRLNHTGFIKILKKHDKHTEYMLKPMFMLRLKSKPLHLESLDNLIFRLSKLYDRIRNTGSSGGFISQDQSTGNDGTQVFVRKTSKYWVHSDNVMEVKCFVLRYLPVLIFPSRKRTVDLAVSSVYLDNDALELYKGRLEKTEGAMAIRIRWYGSDDPKEVFIERKIHREDWTGEVSVKSRFPLKEKYVVDYLNGSMNPEDIVTKLSKDGKRSESELNEIHQLASEIQETILDKKLRPMLRTFYNRTAFQLPGDARVRISLDTELAMIREDGPKRSGNNWKREDIDEDDHHFSSLDEHEIVRFPHAILEVKLQTQSGQDPPKWADALIKSHLVEEVPKFSKYIHGCACVFAELVPAVPFWLPQMGVDIRKPVPVEEGDMTMSGVNLEDEGSSEDLSSPGREGEAMTSLSRHVALEMNIESEEDSPLLGGNSVLNPKPSKGGLFGYFTGRKNNRIENEGISSVRKGQGKKIQVPVRVEPKVFFANERTFLSWVHFAIFLGGIATALVGLGNRKARLSGFLFGIISILFTGYALYLYRWRAKRIRERDPGPYDDKLGPVVVVMVFMLAMVVNLLFAVMEG